MQPITCNRHFQHNIIIFYSHSKISKLSLSQTDKETTEYFLKREKISSVLPDKFLAEDTIKAEVKLIPTETTCPACGSSLDNKDSKQGTVYGCGKVWQSMR